MSIFVFPINNTVETLTLIVDLFDGGRGGQVTFEDINAVTFKVVVGKLAKLGEQLGNTFGIFHDKHSLRICCRACTMAKAQRALRLMFGFKNILTQGFLCCKKRWWKHGRRMQRLS